MNYLAKSILASFSFLGVVTAGSTGWAAGAATAPAVSASVSPETLSALRKARTDSLAAYNALLGPHREKVHQLRAATSANEKEKVTALTAEIRAMNPPLLAARETYQKADAALKAALPPTAK